jgi:hypothetical protein
MAMRRIFAVVLAAVIGALLVVFWRQTQVSIAANQIAPSNAIFYIEVPHLVQTAKNLPNTAIYQIFQEPSVRRFLRQPASAVWKEHWSSWNSFSKLGCTTLFFCATDPNCEHWIAGFQSSANSTARIKEIQNISKTLFARDALYITFERQNTPDIAKEAGGICFTDFGGWTVLSRDADLLRETLQNARSDDHRLHSSKLFQVCHSNLRPGYDLLLFARGSPSLNPADGLGWEYGADQTAGDSQALIASTTIEGSRLRDTVFTWTGNSENTGALSREGFAATSANTIGYLVSRLKLSGFWRLSDKFSRDWPFAATLRDYIGEARSFGIEPQDLDRLVSGIEIVVDRDPGSGSLVTTALLDVADRTKFQQVIDRIVREKLPDSCRPATIAETSAYIASPNENASIVFGLVGEKLVVTWDQSIFAEIVRRLRTKDPGLEQSNQFKEMERLVATPSDLFLYIDARAGFEGFYDASRPMLIFGAALIPSLNRYVDAMALPETDAIAKHLSPIVLSRHHVANGFIDESVGPLTAYEASAFAIGGATAVGLLHQNN